MQQRIEPLWCLFAFKQSQTEMYSESSKMYLHLFSIELTYSMLKLCNDLRDITLPRTYVTSLFQERT